MLNNAKLLAKCLFCFNIERSVEIPYDDIKPLSINLKYSNTTKAIRTLLVVAAMLSAGAVFAQ